MSGFGPKCIRSSLHINRSKEVGMSLIKARNNVRGKKRPTSKLSMEGADTFTTLFRD